ncbi:MAG: cytochrome c family protein [Gammaproteobacteria bacterium]|nr:cytochrome c family protein [Gammaproteobacteria bacterium]
MLLKNLLLPIVLALLLAGLTACERNTDQAAETLTVNQFLNNHWPAVLPPQGKPPDHFSAEEASLDPQACGECHAAQYEQWLTSLHSHTMGAGIQWQLQLMSQQQGNKCLRCHAPLAEQKALVALQQGWPNTPAAAAPAWLPEKLADAGLVCAACHVRRHQRFGPPARAELPEELPHSGFTASQAFQDSRFCAACHQHQEQDKPPRVNGKLQVDTWAQWQASPQAEQGIHCQTCHMPDRQHLWRGIHDADMTRQAIDVKLQLDRLGPDTVNVEATVQNIGAGHHFPTYMVPKVELVFSLRQLDSARERVIHRHIIGWQVNVELTREIFDTRIPAGETQRVGFPLILPDADAAWEITLMLEVTPREHYERTFRRSLQKADKLSELTVSTLRRALREAGATHYRLLEINQPVPGWPIAN